MKKFFIILLSISIAFSCLGCKTNEKPQENNVSIETLPNEPNESITALPNEMVEAKTMFDITLSFAGDCMLATNKDQMTSGSFNEYSQNNSPDYFFKNVKSIFEEDDFTMVNLENVFTNSNVSPISKSGDRVFWFKSKTSNVDILTAGGVDGVSLANNHTNDYGSKGYEDTILTVSNADLQYGTNNDKIVYFEKEGFRIAIICSTLWSSYGTNSIVNKIKEAENQSNYQIVFFHGGTEGIHQPENWKREASKKMIDEGADLVIGNHPHVLQPMEEYNGKTIIYSLGNFCYGGHRQPKNRTIIFQNKITVNKNDFSIEKEENQIIPCYVYTANLNNYQPTPITDEIEKQKVIDFMNNKTESPY